MPTTTTELKELTREDLMKGKPDFDTDECRNAIRSINDTMDVINGKWKFSILIALFFGDKRFSELSKQITKITDRMLSKELRELEINGLVVRKITGDINTITTYSLTDYGFTMNKLIKEMKDWGAKHRLHITGADKK